MGFRNRALKHFFVAQTRSSYYFHLAEIAENARALNALADEQVSFIFPVKSFPHPEILSLMAKTHGGFDVSNQHEFALIQDKLKPGDLVWSSSPVPWQPPAGQSIVMDGASPKLNWPKFVPRSLRVRLTGKPDGFTSRFGYPLEKLVAKDLAEQQITALHFHHGQEPHNREKFVQAIQLMSELARQVSQITHVNLGGGFASLSLPEIQYVVQLAREAFPKQKLIFEPGRWVCGDAGLLLGYVQQLVLDEKRLVAMTSLSRECHLRWQREFFSVSFYGMGAGEALEAQRVLVVGLTCSESDRIADIHTDVKIAEGDVIIVSGVSGYSLAWNHQFNGVPAANVVFI